MYKVGQIYKFKPSVDPHRNKHRARIITVGLESLEIYWYLINDNGTEDSKITQNHWSLPECKREFILDTEVLETVYKSRLALITD